MRARAFSQPHSNVNWRQKISYILGATHFIPCLSTTTFTVLMALIAGMRLKIFVLIPTVLLGQFVVGWLNDYLDRDRDRAAGRQDKPIAMGLVSTKTIMRVMVPSLVVSLTLGFYFGTPAGIVYIIAMASALLYDAYLKFTPLSILSLVVSFGLLPVFVSLGSPHAHYPAAWIVVASALLGATVHFLNVIPDFDDDAKTGVKGFVHYFSYRHALLIGVLLLNLATAAVVYGASIQVNALGFALIGLCIITSLIFFDEYAQDNLKKAFSVAKLLTLLTIFVLLYCAQYM